MDNNLSCEEIKQLISAYYDNELGKDESFIVKVHLDQCSECSLELENLKKVSSLLQKSLYEVEYKQSELSSIIINRVYNEPPITCNEVLEEVSAYYDGELDLKLHYLVKDHLENCPGCSSQYKDMVRISKHIKKLICNNEESLDIWSRLEPEIDNIKECTEISDKLSPFWDKELSKAEMVQVSEHLLSCRYCRRDYENLKETQQVIKSYFDKISLLPNYTDESKVVSILNRVDKSERQKVFFTSIAVVIVLSLFVWFSINIIDPVITRDVYLDRMEIMEKDKPIYVKSEDFLFAESHQELSEGVVSVLYENE